MVTIKKEKLLYLKDRWNAIVKLNTTMQPYQDWEMIRYIHKYYLPFTLAEKEIPQYFSFNENGMTIAIAPMVRRYGDKNPYANFGKAPTIAVKDFIYPANMALEKMVECLNVMKGKLGSIHFYDVPEYSLLYEALEKIGKRCKDNVYTSISYRGGMTLIIKDLQSICARIFGLHTIIWKRMTSKYLLK